VTRLRIFSVLLLILGVAAATLLVGWFGLDKVLGAMLSVGVPGFLGYTAWQVATFIILGIAWWAVVPPEDRRLPIFAWGRMVRDSAGSCLPFSQVGGFVMGARAVRICGVPMTVATLSTIVDLTAEFVAGILFLIVGLVILLFHNQNQDLTAPIAIGAAGALLAGGTAIFLQRRSATIFVKFGRRLLGQFFAGSEASDNELGAMYSHGGRLATGTFLHLLGWVAKGGGNWIAFRLLGADVDFATALAIEAVLHAALGVAVVVPGYAGVQEAGYASIGSLFGIAPEISLAVSLLRRARDLAVGIPILLIWQAIEVRMLRNQA